MSFLPDYKWYRRYYSASLRHLEYDPERDNCWSVITDPVLAETLDINPFVVQLQTWNETKVGATFILLISCENPCITLSVFLDL